jgi:hypothetical protein
MDNYFQEEIMTPQLSIRKEDSQQTNPLKASNQTNGTITNVPEAQGVLLTSTRLPNDGQDSQLNS